MNPFYPPHITTIKYADRAIEVNQKPLIARTKGIKVRIWEEKRVLFVITDGSVTEIRCN